LEYCGAALAGHRRIRDVLIWKLIKWLRRRRAERRRAAAAGTGAGPNRSSPDDDHAAVRQGGSSLARTPVDGDAAISVRGLRKAYGEHEAVRGIDFDVRRGEIVAVLGPNGAGKTTTVEILEGYRDRTAGDVRVLGRDPASAPSEWRASIGVVLQESQPEPYLTARQCLELYAGYYPRPRPINETLDLVGLADRAGAIAADLSGGQRRRLDVALALIGDPDLVFLDEPTTGFDPSARRSAWQVVAGLRDLGKTILLTTHYMDEAEFLADRIIVIAGGLIVAEGTPATLGERDRSRARIEFAVPDGVETALLPAPFQGAPGARVSHESDRVLADLHSLTSWAVEAGIDLPDISVHRPTLEDVYLDLTRDRS
jgi:ABC-2 type transport system ATP-binding protein